LRVLRREDVPGQLEKKKEKEEEEKEQEKEKECDVRWKPKPRNVRDRLPERLKINMVEEKERKTDERQTKDRRKTE